MIDNDEKKFGTLAGADAWIGIDCNGKDGDV